MLYNEFKETTKTSFRKVKYHILALERAIKEEREFVIKQNKAILHLKSEIELLTGEFRELREEMNTLIGSIGNKGVINNHQQSSTTIINNQQSTSQQSSTINSQLEQKKDFAEPVFIEEAPEIKQMHEEAKRVQELGRNQGKDLHSVDSSNGKNAQISQEVPQQRPLSDIKKDLEDKFRYLTDREFSVFMAVYQLEEQLLDGIVNYADVAKMLNISEMTVRGYANSLISKQIPLEKRRLYNRKVALCIPIEFRELNLASFLLTLRLPHAIYVPQKTLKSY